MKPQFYNYTRDGITQSLLGTWLECRQKARYYLQGWTPKGTPLAITNGTIGHGVLQFAYDDYRVGKLKGVPSRQYVHKIITKVEDIWRVENPKPSKQMLQDAEMSALFASVILPIYFDYWKNDFKKLEWEKVEGAFKVPYKTEDGRKTFIRGKMDGVFKRKGLWLFESKFKGMINEGDIVDTLSLDLQVYVYLWVLRRLYKMIPSGVLYNVVRRPGLKLGKAESMIAFGKRVEKDVLKRPEWYFYRFEVATSRKDLDQWAEEFEGLIVDFLDWWDGKVAHYKNSNSCVSKYGRCWGLTPCVSQDYFNLTKRKMVFRELEDV